MTTRQRYWWSRNKEGLGVWEHRGKVALVGWGASPVDRRWDENLEHTLGVYAMIAARNAMEDAGISPDEVDGVITCPGAQFAPGTPNAPQVRIGNAWAPQPYFAPPYDSEDGLTEVSAEWLVKQMGLKNVKYVDSQGDYLWRLMGLAVQAVGDGLCSVALVPYSTGNVAGRYRISEDPYAPGPQQWTDPWGWALSVFGFHFNQYCRKYGATHDGMAPFIVNQRRNGLMVPWGFYAQHEPYQITIEDYLSARWVCKPLSLLDCDRPVNSAHCWVVTTAERARDMKQKPVYVLSHSETPGTFLKSRGLVQTFDEVEEATDLMARLAWEGSGLGPKDIDVFNPYDGFALFTQYFLEAFQWHGVKRGEAHDFYAGDIRVEGPHPFCSGGGNMSTGRTRYTHITDCMEQLQGRAGPRQVQVKAETAATIGATPMGAATLVFSSSPD